MVNMSLLSNFLAIEIILASKDDSTLIANLHALSWKKNYRGILSDQYLDYEVDEDRLSVWEERFKNPALNQVVFKATFDTTIIGFCCLYIDNDPSYGTLIDNLHVLSEYQNSGIGKRLLSAGAKYIKERANLQNCYLWVYEANVNARLAYEKMGGIHVETQTKGGIDSTDATTYRIFWKDASILE
jgi:ribosomal protein S18 acetylase RimI-like enzyme